MKPEILIVDDEADIRTIIAELLEDEAISAGRSPMHRRRVRLFSSFCRLL